MRRRTGFRRARRPGRTAVVAGRRQRAHLRAVGAVSLWPHTGAHAVDARLKRARHVGGAVNARPHAGVYSVMARNGRRRGCHGKGGHKGDAGKE